MLGEISREAANLVAEGQSTASVTAWVERQLATMDAGLASMRNAYNLIDGILGRCREKKLFEGGKGLKKGSYLPPDDGDSRTGRGGGALNL